MANVNSNSPAAKGIARRNVDLRDEILKVVRNAATAQEQDLKVAMESMKRELEKTMKSRKEERERKLALLLEGRQARVAEMKMWKEGKRDICHQRSGEGECAVAILKEAIVQLPRVIHNLDHLRMVEIMEQNSREEERDCVEVKAWREQQLHLDTIIKEQNRDTVARVAQLWKSSPSTSEEHDTVVQPPVADALKCQELEKSTLAPVISSESAVTLALPSKLPPLPSKLPPLPSTLPPLPSTLPPLPSKLPSLPAKLPPLNLPLRRAFCNPVAPLPPIQGKAEQEDLDLESISDHSTQSAVAEHLTVTLDAGDQSPEATSTSESLAAGDSVVEQERKKTRSFKERFFRFLRKLNCCSAKED